MSGKFSWIPLIKESIRHAVLRWMGKQPTASLQSQLDAERNWSKHLSSVIRRQEQDIEKLKEEVRRQKERADMWSHFAPSRLTDLEKSYERKSS